MRFYSLSGHDLSYHVKIISTISASTCSSIITSSPLSRGGTDSGIDSEMNSGTGSNTGSDLTVAHRSGYLKRQNLGYSALSVDQPDTRSW